MRTTPIEPWTVLVLLAQLQALQAVRTLAYVTAVLFINNLVLMVKLRFLSYNRTLNKSFLEHVCCMIPVRVCPQPGSASPHLHAQLVHLFGGRGPG